MESDDGRLILRDDIASDAYDLLLGNGVVAEFSLEADGDRFQFWGLRLSKDVAIGVNPSTTLVNEAATKWLEERLPR